eukprot:621718-Prymnesium_polylepis.1
MSVTVAPGASTDALGNDAAVFWPGLPERRAMPVGAPWPGMSPAPPAKRKSCASTTRFATLALTASTASTQTSDLAMC